MASIVKGQGTASASATGALRTRIELWIAVVFMVLAFAAGLAVGVLAEPNATTPVVGVGQTTTGVPGSSNLAPPLTDEQLQQGLPPGHPGLTGGDQSGKGSNASSGDGNGSKGSGGAKSSDQTSSSGGSNP